MGELRRELGRKIRCCGLSLHNLGTLASILWPDAITLSSSSSCPVHRPVQLIVATLSPAPWVSAPNAPATVCVRPPHVRPDKLSFRQRIPQPDQVPTPLSSSGSVRLDPQYANLSLQFWEKSPP